MVHSPIRLSADLINDRREHSAVALPEGRAVGVGHIEVECSVLGFDEREQTSSHKCFAVQGGAQVMGRVATAWYVGYVK